jgi:glycosyltransferase involved in cell wall biosynthesis
VCISHFSRPHLLDVAIRSIEAQTYDNVQVVLVDDASPDDATHRYLDDLEPRFARRAWKIIRNQQEMWTGAARNLAVSQADGEYVLLMDDDNVAKPHEVETLLRVALNTHADVVTCQLQPFVGTGDPPAGDAELPIGWMPVGPNLAQALFVNCLGDLNMMVRKRTWDKLGGFTVDRYGCEDWEFLVRVLLDENCRLEVVPEILFYYRHSGLNLTYRYSAQEHYDSLRKPLRPVLDVVRQDLRLALSLAVEMRHQSVRLNREGYWRPRDGADSSSQRIATLPLNTGAALVEMARVALKRDQLTSASLLYAQALKNSPANKDAVLEAMFGTRQGLHAAGP